MSDTLDLVKFTAKPATLEAVQVTEENVETVARWMNADSYSIERSLKILGNPPEPMVRFHAFIKERKSQVFSHRLNGYILECYIGDWVLRRPSGISEVGDTFPEDFMRITTKEINEFVKQQRETNEVDIFAPPYDR